MGSTFPLSLCLLTFSFLVSGFPARYSPTIKPVTNDGPGESLCKALAVLQAALVGPGHSTGTGICSVQPHWEKLRFNNITIPLKILK